MTKTMQDYLDNLKNPKHLDEIQQLRTFLQEQLPNATEDLRYGMPTFAHGEDVIVSVGSQKNYMSLYMDMELVEQHRDRLGKLNCGKSCIRFKRLELLPLPVIADILQETVQKQSGSV